MVDTSSLNVQLQSKFVEAQIADYDYGIAIRTYNRKLFEWQLIASNVLLWLVVFVAVSGVLACGYQLLAAAKADKTQFEASWSKIRITSSVVGLMILGMSIVMVLVFTKYVYEVQPLSPTVR